MIKRILFSIKQAVKYRYALQALPFEKNITSIDWLKLNQSGIRAIVLDFDGVLAADDELEIHQDVYDVLRNIKIIFGEHVYILSNKPKQERQDFFARDFPDISFVIAKKKPYPDGLEKIIAQKNYHAREVMLIDDRLLTGGLASILAKTKCIIIEQPYISCSKNFFREAVFMTLRAIERFLFH